MATIDSKEIIDKIIAAKGRQYEDEPAVYMIVEYTNAWGNIAYGVTWENEPAQARTRYLTETYYVRNPKVIFHLENHR